MLLAMLATFLKVTLVMFPAVSAMFPPWLNPQAIALWRKHRMPTNPRVSAVAPEPVAAYPNVARLRRLDDLNDRGRRSFLDNYNRRGRRRYRCCFGRRRIGIRDGGSRRGRRSRRIRGITMTIAAHQYGGRNQAGNPDQ
jgi:hypothetical protein